ncbi:proteasome endopeptidase complex, archaeal, alpha subunit [Halobacteriales archaeon QS_1_68_20]|nr:MAG: proteasome endopeptidase complex, archaeal, alpha subunit [Halobacteriales archaeon QS_1_68_20]
MNGGNQQQAYDRGITIFSPDGRLYQVEYAREAVERGSPSVGLTTDDGVVLLARTRQRSPLVVQDSVEKLHRVDDHLAVASAGHAADARKLVDLARRVAQRERLRYGEPMGVEPLAKAITDHVQEYTQTGGARPYGTALLVGGIDPDTGEARLYETDPSGTPYEWHATAIGADGAEIVSHLEEEYTEELTVDDGLDLGLRALAGTTEDDLGPETVAGAVVTADRVETLGGDRLSDVLAEL